MKKTILAIAVLLSSFGAATVSAQRCATPQCPRQECVKPCPERRASHCCQPRAKKGPGYYCPADTALYCGLNLTPQQKAKLYNLSIKRREANRKAADKFRESKQKAVKTFDKGLEKILTPAQLQQYRDNASRCRSRRVDGARAKKRGDFRRPDFERPDFCPLKGEGK